MSIRQSLYYLLSLIILLPTPSAFAVLGEVKSDRPKSKNSANKLAASTTSYSVIDSSSENTSIKEFVNADGIIFAVSWRGLAQPDLSIILGSYFAEYQTTLSEKKNKNSKTPSLVKTSKAIVQRNGHMRDVRGLAIVPSLLPEGVSAEDLQ